MDNPKVIKKNNKQFNAGGGGCKLVNNLLIFTTFYES